MADEIKFTIEGEVTNGAYKEVLSRTRYEFDQDAIGDYSAVVSVGTSEEDLGVADVTVNGWLYLKNLDTTNYVTWGPKSAGAMVAMGRLEPGEFALFRMAPSSVTLRWVANSAAVKVKAILWQD